MIRIQKSLNHENIAQIKDTLATKNFMFVESESLEFNLREILTAKKNCLSNQHIKYIFYQMILSVANLHDKGIEHLNLSPSSFMIDKHCEVKLNDFSSANPIFLPKRIEMKSTYQNYYTAPETILNNGNNDHCSYKSDIWSLGCIFFELLEGKNVFYHERFYLEQIKWMFKLLGTPTRTNMSWIKNTQAKNWVSKLKKEPKRLPSSYLGQKDLSAKTTDLLNKMLAINPHERLSVLQILKHPYFEELFDENDLKFSESRLSLKNMIECHPENNDLREIKKSLIMETLN
jgi:mitogen-activated protein kinase 7